MNDQLNSAFMDDSEFQSLMVDCLEALQSGKSIDRDALREKFPKYADDLDQYLDVLNVLDQFAGGLQPWKSSGDPVSPYGATVTPHTGNSDVEAGDTIRYIGEYEVLEEIARGGMGVVFKARQQTLKRVVALKMILSGRLADTAEVDRFKREAQAASRLQHPNIVPVHEIGEHEGRQYFTMDYVDGHSLADEIREESLAPKRAARLVKTVAEAVHFAHEKGTLHRDLKPANVLVTPDDVPHVTDFGLAKILDEVDDESWAELTASGQILGTPSYMAPEQAAGKQNAVGPASDIYSLGAILYACLTGRAPFVSDSPVDTLMHVVHKEPVSPRQLAPSIPQDLETICLKCLNKEPHKRYGTAQELADDLERYLQNRPVQARPVSRLERTWRWTKRNPIVASLLLLTVISLTAGTAISTHFAVDASQRAISQSQLRAAAEKQRSIAVDERNRANANLARAEQLLYSTYLRNAQKEWQEGNAMEAYDALDKCDPDLRNWEHDYLYTTFHQNQRTIRGHSHFVRGVFYIRDDTQILSGSVDGTVRIWNAENGQELRKLTGLGMIECMDLSPDESRLAISSWSSFVRVFDVESGDKLLTLKGHQHMIHDVAFSADGQWIATASHDNTAKIWDASSGELRYDYTDHESFVKCVEFSPDGKYLASASSRRVSIRDLSNGKKICEIAAAGARSLAFHPDQPQLAIGSFDGNISVVDILTKETVEVVHGHQSQVLALEFSNDGKFLVSGGGESGDTSVRFWNLEESRLVSPYQGHAIAVSCLDLTEDGTHVVSGGWDAFVKIWDLESPQSAPKLNTTEPVACVEYSVDGQYVIIGLRGGNIEVRDTDRYEIHSQFQSQDNELTELKQSPDGNYLFGLTKSGVLFVWDFKTQELKFQAERVGDFQVSRDSQKVWIRTPKDSNRISLIDLKTFEQIGHIHTAVNELELTTERDVSFLSGTRVSHGWEFLVSELISGQELLTLPRGNQPWSTPRLSPDDRILAICNVDDNLKPIIKIYDLADGREIHALTGHTYKINSLAFHPFEPLLASCSANSIRIWNLKTGIETLRIEGSYWDTDDLQFRPDGKVLLKQAKDGVLFFRADRSDPGLERPRPTLFR